MEEFNIRLGETTSISCEMKTKIMLDGYVQKLINSKNINIDNLDRYDCELLLYLLSGKEFDKNQERIILDVALKSCESDNMTCKGKPMDAGISLTNAILSDSGVQIQIQKNVLNKIYIRFYYDNLGVFSRIRELKGWIEEYEDENGVEIC